ncbi:DNA ligase [Leucothrix mucor]|uniref:DNA ligase n=1 Tax=Leucothrix mucor TaxID=45248 RepID=UPI0003B6AC11|nr:DNA ligase [Leucothrix mucor]
MLSLYATLDNATMNITYTNLSITLAISLLATPFALQAGELPEPDLLLAKVYAKQTDLSQYWASEKYDGVRAYWNGEQFISRQGNVFHAPDWFTEGFPKQALDGELWIGRNTFEQLISAVSKDQPIDSEWQQVRYMVFELPDAPGSFSKRLASLRTQVASVDSDYLALVPQYRIASHDDLMAQLEVVVKAGAEGLMLHHELADYRMGRSDELLKVKRHDDAEARVVSYIPGKGKYHGMMGSLLVEMPDGTQFRVGSGFRDAERRNPPPIGALITYKYFGKTKRGKPKFASFLRLRN